MGADEQSTLSTWDRGYRARRDRQMSNLIDVGTFVKSPDPYVFPNQKDINK